MKVLRLTEAEQAASILEAAKVLRAGGVVVYPTETFYALGAKFDSAEALLRIFTSLKGRPGEKAMPLIAGSAEALDVLASEISAPAHELMRMYWPGPLTLVLSAREGLSRLITFKGTVAVRVPGDSPALGLARACGFPITSTSANPSGRPPARNAAEVMEYFDKGVDLLLDGGTAPGGEPTGIVDTTGGQLNVLRPSRLTEQIKQ